MQDPTDPRGDTLYAGTGEPNASGDSEAGLGVYKSTDGGDTWKLIPSSAAIASTRAIGKIAVDPTDGNIIYVAVARAVRGITSTTGGAVSVTGTAQPNVGVYKTIDGGATWSLVWDAQTAGSVRGVTDVEIDPLDHTTVYAAAFQLGIVRSIAGGTFRQIFAGQVPTVNVDRTELAVTVKDGKTRIYATNGSQGPASGLPFAALYRTDDASALAQGSPNTALWRKLTSSVNGDPFYATFDFCTGQCWYDQDVATPPGQPDTVFVIGSYSYGEAGLRSNARAVVRSTTAGEPDPANGNRTFTDMTWDAQPTPYGIHPDQHEIAFNPIEPGHLVQYSDGGVVRSSGSYVGRLEPVRRPSARRRQPADLPPHAVLGPVADLQSQRGTHHAAVHERVGEPAESDRRGHGRDPGQRHAGLRWNTKRWNQTIYGDGGTSGFNVSNPAIRFNQFFGGFGDVNFRSGDPTAWVVVTAPMLNSGEAVGFYWPEIADPMVPGTMYTGFQHVWRTKNNAGDQDQLETNCAEFTTPGDKVGCGDWVPLGGPAGAGNPGDLTRAALGSRAGGVLGQVERASTDAGTLWASTTVGRVFITKNANADNAASVVFTRLDSLSASAPNRFISGIAIDPGNPNHAWISYSGYNTTPGSTAPGHVFEVTYTPGTTTATWKDRSYDLSDLPVTDVALDDLTGDVYASTDFGVLRLDAGDTSWQLAGEGMPIVETPGLTIVPGARRLYAATHGMGVWFMNLR